MCVCGQIPDRFSYLIKIIEQEACYHWMQKMQLLTLTDFFGAGSRMKGLACPDYFNQFFTIKILSYET